MLWSLSLRTGIGWHWDPSLLGANALSSHNDFLIKRLKSVGAQHRSWGVWLKKGLLNWFITKGCPAVRETNNEAVNWLNYTSDRMFWYPQRLTASSRYNYKHDLTIGSLERQLHASCFRSTVLPCFNRSDETYVIQRRHSQYPIRLYPESNLRNMTRERMRFCAMRRPEYRAPLLSCRVNTFQKKKKNRINENRRSLDPSTTT